MMQPLDPRQRADLLIDRPAAAPGDIDEYERLLSEQFLEDPDLPAAPAIAAQRTQRETRLQELHQRLFGPKDVDLDPQP